MIKYLYDNRENDYVSFSTLVERVIQQLVSITSVYVCVIVCVWGGVGVLLTCLWEPLARIVKVKGQFLLIFSPLKNKEKKFRNTALFEVFFAMIVVVSLSKFSQINQVRHKELYKNLKKKKICFYSLH